MSHFGVQGNISNTISFCLKERGYLLLSFYSFCQLVFEMEGFDVKLEGMFSGQVIPLLSVDGSIQGELRNWSSAVSHVRFRHFRKDKTGPS